MEERRDSMIVRNAARTVLVLFLLGCSEQAKDTNVPVSGSGTEQVGSSHGIEDVTIGPERATAQTVITLKAASGLLNKSDIQWFVNDIRTDSAGGVRFLPDGLSKGDIVHAVLLRDDNEYRSNDIVISNSLPVIREARMHPQTPKLDSRLTVEAVADDPDGDTVSFLYKWYINDEVAGEESYLEPDLKKGDTITVEVTPFDNEGEGRSVRLKNRVFNSLPMIGKEEEPVFDGRTYKYQIHAEDPDGDALTYGLQEGPQGMKVDPASGLIVWEANPKDSGEHTIKVSISDGNGGELVLPLQLKIDVPEQSAPPESEKKAPEQTS